MPVLDTLRKIAGWCPMAAAAQQKNEKVTPEIPQARAGDNAPVERRAVLFSRLAWGIAALAWIVAFAALPHLPEVIPVHWNIYGQADGFSSRVAGAFSLPVIIALTVVLLSVMPRMESMRDRFAESRDIYAIVICATACLLFGIEVTSLLSSSGTALPVDMVFPMLLGFFFIVIGGMMPYIRRNTTIGFRLPWTIRSERVWNETHRIGGPVFVIAGILIVITSPLAGSWATPVMLLILAAAILYLTILSYRLSRSESSCGGT